MIELRSRCKLAFAALLLWSHVDAHEPPSGLLFHLPFDGSLAALGSADGTPELIGKGGEPASAPAVFAEGKFGQSIRFDGDTAVRIPFNLSFKAYPQITVSAWVCPEGPAHGYVISNRSRTGPALAVSGSNVSARGPGAQPGQSGILRAGRWTFVAAVWDTDAGTMRLHYGNISETVALNGTADPAAFDFWIGAWDDALTSPLENIRIDELRVYAGALTPKDLEGLWLGPDSSAGDATLGAPDVAPAHEGFERETPAVDVPEPADTSADDIEAAREAESGTTIEEATRRTVERAESIGNTERAPSAAEQLESARSADSGQSIEELNESLRERTPAIGDPTRMQTPADELIDARDRASGDASGSGEYETRRQGLEEETISGEGRVTAPGSVEVTEADSAELYVDIDTSVQGSVILDVSEEYATRYHSLDLRDSALHSITWRERGDRACDIEIRGYARGLNQFGAPRTKSARQEFCDGDGGTARSELTVSLLPDRAAITEIRGCEADKTENPLVLTLPESSDSRGSGYEPLKGLAVGGYVITSDHGLGTGQASSRAERPHCKGEWRPRTSCPGGTVMTGVRLQLVYNEIRGLSPICRPVAEQ